MARASPCSQPLRSQYHSPLRSRRRRSVLSFRRDTRVLLADLSTANSGQSPAERGRQARLSEAVREGGRRTPVRAHYGDGATASWPKRSRGVAEATALQCRFHARVSHKVVWERLLGARASGHQTVERDESAVVSQREAGDGHFWSPPLTAPGTRRRFKRHPHTSAIASCGSAETSVPRPERRRVRAGGDDCVSRKSGGAARGRASCDAKHAGHRKPKRVRRGCACGSVCDCVDAGPSKA